MDSSTCLLLTNPLIQKKFSFWSLEKAPSQVERAEQRSIQPSRQPRNTETTMGGASKGRTNERVEAQKQ